MKDMNTHNGEVFDTYCIIAIMIGHKKSLGSDILSGAYLYGLGMQ